MSTPPHDESTLDPTETLDETVTPEAPEEPEEAAAAERETDHPRPPPPDLRDLRIQTLERALAEREATLHTYIRAHKKAESEFEAFRQRLERDRERELMAARAKLVERLLEVDDNLERTIAAAQQGGPNAADALIQGAQLVHQLFVERLVELGLERHDPTGEPFDPTTMEAFGIVATSDPLKNDTVAMTFRVGYRMQDREIRPALVQVAKFMN